MAGNTVNSLHSNSKVYHRLTD